MTRQRTEEGGLAATGWPEDADELTGVHGEVQPLNRLERLAALPQVNRQATTVNPPRRLLITVHQEALRVRYQGVASAPRRLTRALLPMPSTPMSNMPTMMSG
ncbi:hypothetical protein D3C79_1004250 [compost metagenome]